MTKTLKKPPSYIKIIIVFLAQCFFLSCNNDRPHIGVKEIVKKPEEINQKAEEVIQGTLKDMLENNKEIKDSFKLNDPTIIHYLYNQNSFQPIWSARGIFNKYGDSLFSFIADSKYYGLFPNDYYYEKLTRLKTQLIGDTSSKDKKLDASLWAYSDMILTSAFVRIVKDLKIGRLLPDSVIMKDTAFSPAFFLDQLKLYQQSDNDNFAFQLEPVNTEYRQLKAAMQRFLAAADFKKYTYVNAHDSIQLPGFLSKRLSEEDSSIAYINIPDSLQLSWAIKQYQKLKHIKVDGKVSATLIGRLNDNDAEKFIKIAINLDRYKLLPLMPEQYIWVNLPSYYLQVRDSDTVVFRSRIVIGKPTTRTPIITSAISDMITYPQWHVPESIIKKEILPGLKKNPGYTISKGLSLLDKDGNEVNPYLETWTKYKNSIPYNVVQGSGDENALGVLKFNFPNRFDVYLHDTNQRYLFSKTSRALSHGCVRVQEWKQLATYILKNDSLYTPKAVPLDSMQSWLVLKQKHYIPVHKPIPLFIRYFTLDTKENNLVFYEDIYGEDEKIREKLFTNK